MVTSETVGASQHMEAKSRRRGQRRPGRWGVLSLATIATAALVIVMPGSAAHAVVRTCFGIYHIKAANGLYVTNEQSHATYPGMLRARTAAGALGTWEVFRVYQHTNGVGAQSYSIQASNGKYVKVEDTLGGGDKAMLRAVLAGDGDSTQHFTFSPDDFPKNGAVNQIYAHKTSKYVANEEGYTGDRKGMLRARTSASARGTWENFIMEKIGSCT